MPGRKIKACKITAFAGAFQEGFYKRRILVVCNAGVPIYRDNKAKDGQKRSFAKPSLKSYRWFV